MSTSIKEVNIGSGYDDRIGLVMDRIFSVHVTPSSNVVFTEECDGYFSDEVTKEEAIEILKSFITYIEDKTK